MNSAENQARQRRAVAERRWLFWCTVAECHAKAGRKGLADEARERADSFKRQMDGYAAWLKGEELLQ